MGDASCAGRDRLCCSPLAVRVDGGGLGEELPNGDGLSGLRRWRREDDRVAARTVSMTTIARC